MSMWFSILTVLFILSSVILVLVILVQRPQGGGLAQAFGGASGGGTDTAFGGRTGDVLTYLTMGAFALYLLVAIGLNVVDNQNSTPGTQTEEQMIDPGLLPTDPTKTTVTPTGTTPTTPAPAADSVPAANQSLTAPEAPAPAPATEAPAGGKP
jgi:preprotein translocase subunit SecG